MVSLRDSVSARILLPICLIYMVGAPSARADILIGYDPVALSNCFAHMGSYCQNLNVPGATNTYGVWSTDSHSNTRIVSPTITAIEMFIGLTCSVTPPGGTAGPAYTGARCSWSYALGGDEIPKQPPSNNGGGLNNGPANNQCGSIINPNDLSLGEVIDLPGVDDRLFYSTNRVVGRETDYKVQIPVIRYPDQLDSGVKMRVTLAGVTSQVSYTEAELAAGLFHEVIWNGRDENGTLTPGATEIKIDYLDSFIESQVPGYNFPHVTLTFPVGAWKAYISGLGGWDLGSHHYYDALKSTLYQGNGSLRFVQPIAKYYDDETAQLREPNINDSELLNVNLVSSADGAEVYLFDISNGRHLRTLSGVSGKTLRIFSYDGAGKLTAVEDGFGNITQIQRPDNQTVQIISPFGQVNTLHLNADGWMERFESPNHKNYLMTYKDAMGLLTSFTKPSGAVATFQYDSEGYLIKDINTSGSLWDIVLNFEANHRSVRMSTAEGLQYGYEIALTGNNSGFQRTETEPGGASRTVVFNIGQYSETYETDGSYSIDYFAFDPRFGVNATRMSSGNRASPYGQNLSYTESYSATEDPQNYAKLISESFMHTEGADQWTRNFNGSTKQYTSRTPEGRMTRTTINDHNQIIRSQTGSFTPVNYIYDARGRIQAIAHGSRQYLFSYNAQGFLSSLTNPLSQTQSFEYSPDGELTKEIYPDGRAINYSYDAAGRMSAIQPPSKPEHSFVYNLFDSIAEYVAPSLNGQTFKTSYEYNNDGKVTKIHRPSGKDITFSYSPTSGLLEAIAITGQNVLMSYNSANQLDQMNTTEGLSSSLTYDGHLVTQESVGFGSVSSTLKYTYQNFLLKTIQAGTQPAITLTYDRDKALVSAGPIQMSRSSDSGQIISMVVDAIHEVFEYSNDFGELSEHTASRGSQTYINEVYLRDALGRVEFKTSGSDLYKYIYDSSGRLIEAQVNGQTQGQYLYDANGNRTSSTVRGVASLATYDDQDRLLTYGKNVYEYDLDGQLTKKTTLVPSSTSGATANAINTNAPTSKSKGANNKFIKNNKNLCKQLEKAEARLLRYLEDLIKRRAKLKNQIAKKIVDLQIKWVKALLTANAKLQIKANCKDDPPPDIEQVTNYSYDELGNLRTVQLPSGSQISYLYDGLGRRTSRTSSSGIVYYLYRDPYKISATLNSTGAIESEFIYAKNINVPDAMIKGGLTYKLITDYLGSVRYVVNASSGEVAQQMTYDEFGNVLTDTNPGFQPFGFAGGLYDVDSKLVRFGARDYDPETGRWTSKDPILFNGSDTNLYGYTFNDPINFIDPNGKDAVCLGGNIGSIIAIRWEINTLKNQINRLDQLIPPGGGSRDGELCPGESQNDARNRRLRDSLMNELRQLENELNFRQNNWLNIPAICNPAGGADNGA